jgi:hypothetical protein
LGLQIARVVENFIIATEFSKTNDIMVRLAYKTWYLKHFLKKILHLSQKLRSLLISLETSRENTVFSLLTVEVQLKIQFDAP